MMTQTMRHQLKRVLSTLCFASQRVLILLLLRKNLATVPAKAVVETKPAQTSAPVKTNNNTRGERRYGGDNGEAHREGKDNNQRPKYNKDGVKPKGVPAEPHP